jgi:hypothetical protein
VYSIFQGGELKQKEKGAVSDASHGRKYMHRYIPSITANFAIYTSYRVDTICILVEHGEEIYHLDLGLRGSTRRHLSACEGAEQSDICTTFEENVRE